MKQHSLSFTPSVEAVSVETLNMHPWVSYLLTHSISTFQQLTQRMVEYKAERLSPVGLCSIDGMMGFVEHVVLVDDKLASVSMRLFGEPRERFMKYIMARIQFRELTKAPFAMSQLPACVFGLHYNGTIYKIAAMQIDSCTSNERYIPESSWPLAYAYRTRPTLDTVPWADDTFELPSDYSSAVAFPDKLESISVTLSFNVVKR